MDRHPIQDVFLPHAQWSWVLQIHCDSEQDQVILKMNEYINEHAKSKTSCLYKVSFCIKSRDDIASWLTAEELTVCLPDWIMIAS